MFVLVVMKELKTQTQNVFTLNANSYLSEKNRKGYKNKIQIYSNNNNRKNRQASKHCITYMYYLENSILL